MNSSYQNSLIEAGCDEAGRIISVIQNLTRTDFPELKISITDDGWITIPTVIAMVLKELNR